MPGFFQFLFMVPVLCLAAAGLCKLRKLRAKRLRRQSGARWSVALETSADPFHWRPDRGRRLPAEATGGTAAADPFLLERDGRLFVFFERIEAGASRATIAAAVHDPQTAAWRPLGIVLREPFHLSYPHVFAEGHEVYMLPEAKQSGTVRLYRAVDFPLRWEHQADLVRSCRLVDPTLVHHEGAWYLFASRHRTLRLFVAERLCGPWRPHPQSPVRRGNYSRCAGRILRYQGRLFRFAQEQRAYGAAVHVFCVETLTPRRFRESRCRAGPLLEAGAAAWCATGMHHIDILPRADGTFLAAYDGEGTG